MKLSHKLFLILIKYVPVIQMIGTLIRSALQVNEYIVAEYILDCICGTTLVSFTLSMLCSYIFKFCAIHRLLIMCNLVNCLILNTTNIINVFGTDINISLISHYTCNVVLAIFIIKLFKSKNNFVDKDVIIEKINHL